MKATFDPSNAAAILGAIGGSKTSARKAASSRRNGAKGGRPKKAIRTAHGTYFAPERPGKKETTKGNGQ
jgi:hypothetical protein